MTNILVAGLKEPPGGVENAILTYTENFESDSINVDFIFTCAKVSFENRLLPGRAFYLPSRIRHPLLYRKEIKRILKQTAYDALWCNYSGLTNIDLLKEAKKIGTKKRIIHSHTSNLSWGNMLMKYLVPFFHNKNKKVIDKYATDFWACSKKSASFMYGEEIAKKTTIIPNAVDTALFSKDIATREEVRNEFSIPADAVVIGHIGRMCVEKNQLFLLDIMKEITKINRNTRLLFVGDGELKDIVIQYAKDIGIDSYVIFTGTRKDVPRLIQAMDVFLLPSLSEGLPVTVIEAQAADIPVVVSSEAVTREADITDTLEFISLSEDAALWAQKTLASTNRDCKSGAEKLINAGYDCKIQSKKLQDFFKGDILKI